VISVGWLFRGGLPERIHVLFREPGPPPALGLPGVQPALYVRNDKWASYLAPESVCPGGESAGAPDAEQETTMLCLINFARRRAGLKPLRASTVLSLAASFKARDIVHCRHFAHAACGRNPRAVADEARYPRVSWGENLYMGTGALGAPRPALDGWLNSPHHRENLLNPAWTEQGIALRVAKHFSYGFDYEVWASEFGARPT
jgi:uncharacterized protein YkwD